MPVVIELTPEQEANLERYAATHGQPPSEYARAVLVRDLERQSFHEFLAPLRQQVEESGITDDELEALIEEARDEVWREKQARSSG